MKNDLPAIGIIDGSMRAARTIEKAKADGLQARLFSGLWQHRHGDEIARGGVVR